MCRLKESDFSFPDLILVALELQFTLFYRLPLGGTRQFLLENRIHLTRLGTFHGHLTPVLI